MRRTVKSLEEEVKEIHARKEEWRNKFYNEEKERLRLRRWIQEKLNWLIELSSDNKRPCINYFIKDIAKILGMKEE